MTRTNYSIKESVRNSIQHLETEIEANNYCDIKMNHKGFSFEIIKNFIK